ncbi:MAG: prohibitin family protein [Candidatus Caenarcaniphilales bacterium]|nr:prohibitin family protein [Candidatus Caenarcaniphilales bacterium]
MFGLGLKKELILISLFALLALVSQSVRIVEAGRTGVVFNISGGVQKKPLKEGLHFLIPFVQSLIVFDTRLNTYSFTRDKMNSGRLGDPIVAKTSDGQIVGIEMSLLTQMIHDKAPEVYQKLRTDYAQVLKAKTGKVMQEVIAMQVADALYTESTRKAVSKTSLELLSESFAQSGFKLHDVLIRRIVFSKEYIEAIERKQIALQKAQLAQIRKEIALKEKTIAIIQGEAKAKEVAIKGGAIQANPLVADLEYLDAIESNNLDVPVITGLKSNAFINLDKVIR